MECFSFVQGLCGGSRQYTIGDQVARFARAKAENNAHYLDIDTVYTASKQYLDNPSLCVLITGANRGLGFAILQELVKSTTVGKIICCCRTTTDEDFVKQVVHANSTSPDRVVVLPNIDVTSCAALESAASELLALRIKVDILIHNAGYYYEKQEVLLQKEIKDPTRQSGLNFGEQMKQIDVCALSLLKISGAFVNQGLIVKGGKIVCITSQAGSCAWRFIQNPKGGDYGHHMSRAACNMAGVLLTQELKSEGICVGLLHPGFNRTRMTLKFSHIWDIEGAVEPLVGAKRVLHEICRVNLENWNGKFVNCEDGLEIPF